MTEQERRVFEELLSQATKVTRHLGKAMPLEIVLSISMPATRAMNAAERILDPLRSPEERQSVENEIAWRP